MSSEQTFSTNDLRAGAKEFSRDKDHRVKWAHGASFGPGRRPEDNRPRPARVYNAPKSCRGQRGLSTGCQKARSALQNDMNSASDSSADEDIDLPRDSVASVPDQQVALALADVTYSFDAARGPSNGSQILNIALEKAIEKYEVKQTDKLIKEEYEVLDVAKEALSPGPRAVRKNVAPEDEDYLFIEV